MIDLDEIGWRIADAWEEVPKTGVSTSSSTR